jgi:hypothetical protein
LPAFAIFEPKTNGQTPPAKPVHDPVAYEAKLAKQRADYEQHQRDMEAARKLRESQGGSLFGDRLKPRQPAKEAEHGSD